MPSVISECDQLKQVYDRCFTDYFQHFISPGTVFFRNSNPCERVHAVYRECLEKGLAEKRLYDIDLDELRREVLNTEFDRSKSHSH